MWRLRRIASRILYFLVAILCLAAMAGVGAVLFFALLGILMVLGIFHTVRYRSIMGASRDAAFSFNREDFQVRTNPAPSPVIDGEYQDITASRAEEKQA